MSADPDTSLTINGYSDSVLLQLSTDCFITLSQAGIWYQASQGEKLIADVGSDSLSINFSTVDLSEGRVRLTTDLIQFDLSRLTVAMTRADPVMQQLYINQTTNSRGDTNVCLRSSSPSDEPTIILQPNAGKLTLYTSPNDKMNTDDPIGETYSPPLTLNMFGSQFIGSQWGETYFFRMGGLYPTRRNGIQIVYLLDTSDTVATIEFSKYALQKKMIQFVAHGSALMSPTSGDNYFNDCFHFTGVVFSTQSRLRILKRDRLVRGYRKGSLSWVLTPSGDLNYVIRYNNRFDYSGPTQIHGLLCITVMSTSVNGLPRQCSEASFSSTQTTRSFSGSSLSDQSIDWRTTALSQTKNRDEPDSNQGKFPDGEDVQPHCRWSIQ